MLKNYFLVALRNIRRSKGYSFINILGLAVGMACFVLIALWARDELSYDRYHANAARLFRVADYEKYSDGTDLRFYSNPPELARILVADYPEIQDAVRFRRMSGTIVRSGDRFFNEEGVAFSDASFLRMFTFHFLAGDANSALQSPRSIVITRRMAGKYFDSTDVVGKTLLLDNRLDFTISAVIEDLPSNSHLNFDFLGPFEALKQFDMATEGWGVYAYTTYVLLVPGADYRRTSLQIRDVIRERDKEVIADLSLQPVTDIHLDGDRSMVHIFALIAAFVLLTACINYMNLATARAGRRSKEVALRKVTGAGRLQIALQFFGESLLLSFFALAVALLLVYFLLPLFNSLSGKELNFGMVANGPMMAILLISTLSAGLFSGTYPALMISGLKPAQIFNGTWRTGAGTASFRKLLVSLQFVLTIALIIGTILINRQLHFIRNFKLGYDKEQVLLLNLYGDSGQKYSPLKTEMRRVPGVVSASAASDLLTGSHSSRLADEWDGRAANGRVLLFLLNSDPDFAATTGIRLKEGRYFSDRFIGDVKESVVLNEAAVRAMGMVSPVGKKAMGLQVIGVIKDFHFMSLHSAVRPLAIQYVPEESTALKFRHLYVKFRTRDIHGLIDSLESTWRKVVPGIPFTYQFLDETIDTSYRTDEKVGRIVSSFTVLALFIACLGLVGMASFVTELRTKEIGVRKVLGASVFGVSFMLVREFTKWVLLANLIAWPIAYLAMSRLLQIYAYRISLTLWPFVVSGMLALSLAVLAVGLQSVKAALADPVNSLRYE